MRFILAMITLTSLIFVSYSSIPYKNCGCAADDGSCRVYGSCPKGCLALCPNGGGCSVTCVDSNYGGYEDLSAPVTLQVRGVNGGKVAAELTRLTGAEIIFMPTGADAVFNIEVKDEPLWNVLETLSTEGSVQIGRHDFGHVRKVRQALLSGERMAACFDNVTAERLAYELSFLSGREVYVATGDPETPVFYKGKQATFEEIVTAVSLSSGVQIAIK
jgi:hypothetical protein